MIMGIKFQKFEEVLKKFVNGDERERSMRNSADEKKMLMKDLIMRSLIAGLAASVAVGCTKTKDLQNKVDPNAYLAGSEFGVTKPVYDKNGNCVEKQTSTVYHLVRGVEEAESSNTMGAVPGMSEDFGLVRVRITESDLQLVSMFDPMNRQETATIIASFPIKSHFDIKREENDYKEKTNKIVEDTERRWCEREYMRIDWANPSNTTSKLTHSIGGDGTREENTVLLENVKSENGHISWLTETSLKSDQYYKWIAWEDYTVVGSSRVIYRTHLMPSKQTDYQPVVYKANDYARFGYFMTQQNWEDPLRGLRDSKIVTYANTHNVCEPGRTLNGKALSCSTNKIVWHLNKGFPEKYRAVAKEAVNQWNQTFKKALDRKDDVVVLAEEEVDRIDPRYNVISHYGPDSAQGPYGVAQFVTDPRTGEFVSVRATVYEQGMRDMMAEVDDLIDMLSEQDPSLASFQAGPSDLTAKAKIGQTTAAYKQQLKLASAKMQVPSSLRPAASGFKPLDVAMPDLAQRFKGNTSEATARTMRVMRDHPEVFSFEAVKNIGGLLSPEKFIAPGWTAASKEPQFNVNGFENVALISERIRANKRADIEMAKRGVHGSELVEEAVENYLLKLVKSTNPKDLVAKREEIKAEVDRRVFYMLLLHEMGHALGLRHNFLGSVDKDHFHPEYDRLLAEVKAGRAKAEELEPYKFSSVMDYVADFFEWHGGTSKYDLAAIRYGYNRSINREADPISTPPGQKPYLFCSDEEVGENILCNRWDKGTTVTEIVQNRIHAYERSYLKRHFRRDRARFDRSAGGYVGWTLEGTFLPIRQVMDEYLYQLIRPWEPGEGSGNRISALINKSIQNGEMANFRDPQVGAMLGLSGEESLANALMDPKKRMELLEKAKKEGRAELTEAERRSALLKSPGDLEPAGFADLTHANYLARNFFYDVIASAEPGTYLAQPVEDKSSGTAIHVLNPVPGDAALSPEAKLLAAVKAEGANDADAAKFVNENKGRLVTLNIGRRAMPYSDVIENVGKHPRLMRLGSVHDKIAAIQALAVPVMPVDKYLRMSLTGNAYSYPQTRETTVEIFKNLVTNNAIFVRSFPAKLASGQVVNAVAPSSLGLDTQRFGTIASLFYFVFDGETKIVDKMRICSENEQGCNGGLGQAVAQFTRAQGQGSYRAAQTLDGNSFVFDMVSAAATEDIERQELVKLQQGLSDYHASAIMKVNDLDDEIKRIDENLAKYPEYAEIRKALTGEQGALTVAKMLIEKLLETPASQVEPMQEQIVNIVNRAASALAGEAAKLKDVPPCESLKCPQAKEVAKKEALAEISADFKPIFATLNELFKTNSKLATAPGRIEELTGSIERKEGDIRRIRTILKIVNED